MKYIGHVNRRFVGLTLAGRDLPQTRSVIRKEGKDVGYVTTTLFSPGVNKPIALGFVNRVAYGPGTDVEVIAGDKSVAAMIVDLPFVEKK